METEYKSKLDSVKEEMETEKDSEVRKAVEKERVKATNRAEVDREIAVKEEEEKWKIKMERDLETRLEKEKRDWEENNEIDVLQVTIILTKLYPTQLLLYWSHFVHLSALCFHCRCSYLRFQWMD